MEFHKAISHMNKLCLIFIFLRERKYYLSINKACAQEFKKDTLLLTYFTSIELPTVAIGSPGS